MDNIITTEQLVAGGNDIRIRQMSAKICSLFEDALADKDVYIPSDDREGDEDEACLYGDVYADLEDAVTETLSGVKANFDSTQLKSMAFDICQLFETVIAPHKVFFDEAGLLPKDGVCLNITKFEMACRIEEDIAVLLAIIKKYPQKPLNLYQY